MTVERRQASAFVGLIGGRWTLMMLAELAPGGRRYRDLHDGLDGISHKVLTDTLRRAGRDGLIRRISIPAGWTRQTSTNSQI